MHHKGFALSFLLSTLALARLQVDAGGLSGFPVCAQDITAASLNSSGCPLTDIACICGSAAFIKAITNTIVQSCSASDVQAAIAFGQAICGPSLGAALPSTSSTPESSPAPVGPTNNSYGATTTTVPGTLTSMTSVPADGSMSACMRTSVSTTPDTHYQSGMIATTYTTTTMMTTTSGTDSHLATFTGAAFNAKAGQDIMAAALGVAGAVALL
ncbi:uncharacterized protein Z518_06548 [Rhinocladiella mackenziei CBS 650.93]|uniref:CFEM domain-containing protein n=1 Tax=Rhinocladiella mackenziei CBS 650.93 TaxID=1442369 RepID=A0A0D2GXV7_9EURO|nr:uncharacterized protein Z518_06548 [Rhinocladiella mackenziei CBS 650.93]KIX02998.1 hypothetical protein Z518_06548 [Rhinocladiella mackenziei CBS 650.93]